jgi:hypothetical protein
MRCLLVRDQAKLSLLPSGVITDGDRLAKRSTCNPTSSNVQQNHLMPIILSGS